MLFVLFQLGPDRYALPAAQIRAIVPRVSLRLLPQTPPAVAGLLSYQGKAVPVIDLNQLAHAAPSNTALSSRIALAIYPVSPDRHELLGLIAEQMTDAIAITPDQIRDIPLRFAGNAFQGQLIRHDQNWIPTLRLPDVLPASLRDCLYPAT